jgi:hypothetical protein
MLPPITIPDLDPAGPIDFNNDLLLVRQGLNDKKATASQISNLRLNTFSDLPGQVQATDKIIVGRNDGAGGYTNYIADPRSIGFLVNTVCYFYMSSAPLTWTIVPNSGNKLLAVADNTGNLYSGGGGGTFQGTWQQTDTILSIEQIPAHSHAVLTYNNFGSFGNEFTSVKRFGNSLTIITNPTGGSGSTTAQSTVPPGATLGHNHGNSWRPAAAVGILCRKSS